VFSTAANWLTCLCLLIGVLAPPAHADSPRGSAAQPLVLAKAPVAASSSASNRTLAVTSAGQGRRIALVIGNGAYQHPDNLPPLANPANDAQDIAKALRGFGFEVIERRNQTLEAMNQAIAEFGSRIGGSEAALFYFAGHGIQVKNQNYLMPINARVESEAAVPYQGVNLNQILDEIDNARSQANIVMLDACRNNPISGKFRSGRSRGLASPGSVPKGTVIVYATDPGNVAADGDGRNGLFTAGLLTAFKGKNLSLDDVLTVASAEVERASGQTQTPYVNGPKLLQKNFSFRTGVEPGRDAAPPSPAQAATPPATPNGDPDSQLWNQVKTNGSREYLDAYLSQYPNGKYAVLARIELKKLDELARVQTRREEAPPRNQGSAGRATDAGNPTIEMRTSKGILIIELYPDKAPKSVENFLQYVREGFYNGTIFHRVIPDFMIQGGGFTADMTQKRTRAPIRNEAANGLKNELGTLAMARKADPHSADAQFFINLKDNSFLDYNGRDGSGYAVFGKVIQGLDVVRQIAQVATGNSGSHQNVPTAPLLIESVKLPAARR